MNSRLASASEPEGERAVRRDRASNASEGAEFLMQIFAASDARRDRGHPSRKKVLSELQVLFGFEKFVIPVADRDLRDIGDLADSGLSGFLVGEQRGGVNSGGG